MFLSIQEITSEDSYVLKNHNVLHYLGGLSSLENFLVSSHLTDVCNNVVNTKGQILAHFIDKNLKRVRELAGQCDSRSPLTCPAGYPFRAHTTAFSFLFERKTFCN